MTNTNTQQKQKRYGLGEFNCPVHIIYKMTKSGTRAYRYHGGLTRQLPIKVALADAIVAAGEAVTVQYFDRPAQRWNEEAGQYI